MTIHSLFPLTASSGSEGENSHCYCHLQKPVQSFSVCIMYVCTIYVRLKKENSQVPSGTYQQNGNYLNFFL